MQLKRFLMLLPLVLSACSNDDKQSVPTLDERPLVVKLHTVSPASGERQFHFPAKISAVKTIDIAFEVSGRLTRLDLVQGRQLKKGHLLAAIDSSPFDRQVKENRARNEHAQSVIKRIDTLFKQKMASQQEHDQARTQAEIAALELSNSIQNLGYTQLTAPFDALVSERLVENNSYVRAGDVIARLQDVSQVYFTTSVAERFFRTRLRQNITNLSANFRGKNYKVSYVEHSTQSDPITQTYKVVLAMEPVAGQQFPPGSSATITVTFIDNRLSQGVYAPFSALVGDKNKGFTVWRVRPDSNTVEQVPVSTGIVTDDFVGITAGLNAGDKIVAAGMSKLYQGRLVKEYQPEQ